MTPTPFVGYPKKYPYYIVAPAYLRASAGVKVLHYLCRAIRGLGYEAYLVTPRMNHYLETPQLTQEILENHYDHRLTPIAVYPETLYGNPLEVPFVVRYILNIPGLLGGTESFDKNEFLLYYSKDLAPKGQPQNILFFPASDTSIFFPPSPEIKRKGSCFYAGKYKYSLGGVLSAVTKNSLEIHRGSAPEAQSPIEIAEIFRQSEIFYCYENSALSLEAMLCGCPVALIPNKHLTTVIANSELGNDGMSWGTEPQDIEQARQTVHKVWDNYQRLNDQFFMQLNTFISTTQLKAAGIPYVKQARFINVYDILEKATSKSKLGRLLSLILQSLKYPPRKRDLSRLAEAIRSRNFKGVKRALALRETELSLRGQR